jgi:hypothetical protein
MSVPVAVREHLVRLLAWSDAHVSFDDAVEGFPVPQAAVRPAGLPHSVWELLEHLRITQADILDFCVADTYREPRWPEDYWPASPAPPDDGAWAESVARFRADRGRLQALAADTSVNLLESVPHGSDQTYLRELILAADHASYHVGQLVLVRRALGAWPAG